MLSNMSDEDPFKSDQNAAVLALIKNGTQKAKKKPLFNSEHDTVGYRRRRFLEGWRRHVNHEYMLKTDARARGLYAETYRYLKFLSGLAFTESLPLDMVVIGASAGDTDGLVRKFQVMPHWRGVFVEPDWNNFQRLQKNLAGATQPDRAYFIHAAVTDACPENGLLTFYKPLVPPSDPKKKSHLLGGNEFGSLHSDVVLKTGGIVGATDIVSTSVPCKTVADVLHDANAHFLRHPTGRFQYHYKYNLVETYPFQPMYVQVDTEGHDRVVLESYMDAMDRHVLLTNSPDPAPRPPSTWGALAGWLGFSAPDPPPLGRQCQFKPLMVFYEVNKLAVKDRDAIAEGLNQRGYKVCT